MGQSHSQDIKVRVLARGVIVETIVGVCQKQLCGASQESAAGNGL